MYLPMHHIKGLSVTILLQRGSLGDRSEKGGIDCDIAQNLCNFNNLMILPENCDRKRGHSVTDRCKKGGVYDI